MKRVITAADSSWTLDSKIYDWYKSLYPDDYQLDSIDKQITFKDLAPDGSNIDKIGPVDTFVSNQIRNQLMDLTPVSPDKLRSDLKDEIEKSGYRFGDAYWDGNSIELNISPSNQFAGEIRVKKTRGSDKIDFVAQTPAFGSLSTEDYGEYANQVKKTNNLLRYLYTFDWKGLKED